MESIATGSLKYAMQCSGEGDENLRLLKKHCEIIEAKAKIAHDILEAHHDLVGWDPADPNLGLLRAQNAVFFLQAASVGMAQLADHFRHNKERHLTVVEISRKRIDDMYGKHADLLETVA